MSDASHVCRLLERVQELEASEARVRELEADAMLRSLDEEASFSSAGSREPYDLPFDRDWVRPPASIHGHECMLWTAYKPCHAPPVNRLPASVGIMACLGWTSNWL